MAVYSISNSKEIGEKMFYSLLEKFFYITYPRVGKVKVFIKQDENDEFYLNCDYSLKFGVYKVDQENLARTWEDSLKESIELPFSSVIVSEKYKRYLEMGRVKLVLK